MKKVVTMFLVAIGLTVQAQSLRDTTMQNMSKSIVMEVIEPIELDVSFASVVIMETNSGIVKSIVNLKRTGWGWIEDDDVKHYLAAGNRRAALFLALLESGASPNEMFYTSGIYTDPSTGYTIRDWHWSWGGLGNIPLSIAMDRSDVSIIEACDQHFFHSVGDYAFYMSKTGIDLGNKVPEDTYEYYSHAYERTVWDPATILGYRDRITPLEMTMWMQGVANDGKMMQPRFYETDSVKIIYEQMAKKENIDSLQMALREAVQYGMSKKVSSEYVPVYGTTNVSIENGEKDRCSMFSGYIPEYTITVNLVMSGSLIRIAPLRIAKKIVDWIALNRLGIKEKPKTNHKKRPLPKGVD